MWRTTPVEKKENRSDIRCNGTDTRDERKEILVTEVDEGDWKNSASSLVVVVSHGLFAKIPLNLLLVHVVVEVDGIRVGRSCRCFLACRGRAIASLGSSAGSNKAHRGTSLALQCSHGIRTLGSLAFALRAILRALLTTSNSLRGDEVDVGARKRSVY
jgi:hypothetical protein